MHHKLMSHSRGSVLVIALFIIIVFGALSVALNKLRVDDSNSYVLSTLREQSKLASYTALEIATQQLYPLNHHGESGEYSIDDKKGRCVNVTTTVKFDSNLFPVLSRCQVDISCDRRGAQVDNPTEEFGNYTAQVNYFLKAQANCTFGSSDTDGYFKVSNTEYYSLIDGD